MCADLRHGDVAAVYDDVPQIRVPPLVRQVQGERGPQRLVEPSETGHRRGWRVVGRRVPGQTPLKVHVADCLVG